jgi:tRNA pseudouridine55 synthase
MNGILVVNKEAKMTSNTLIQKIKRTLNIKKIGHAGTLDPDATGVMIVLLNDATKLSNYLLSDDKEYIAEVIIGESRDTEDSSGVLVTKEYVEKLNDVDEVLASLIGKSEQTPPMYSAIKQDGKKLYELARQGITVDRVSRTIEIHELKRVSEITYNDGIAKFTIKVKVTKGTYIRTLSVRIGELLGYPSHMGDLIRTASGDFKIEDSYKLKDLEDGNYKVISNLDALNKYSSIEVDDELKQKVLNGIALDSTLLKSDKEVVVLKNNNQLLGIYKYQEGIYKAERVWN